MSESRIADSLPEWIKDHLRRYLATEGVDGHLWDATLGGGTGMDGAQTWSDVARGASAGGKITEGRQRVRIRAG